MNSFDIGIISANIGYNSIYRDPKALDVNLPAPVLLHRDKEALELVKLLTNKVAFPYIVMLRGRSGTGKTATAKLVCDDNVRISSEFVDMRRTNSILGSLNLVLSKLGEPAVPSAKGENGALASLEVAIEKHIEELYPKKLVLVLDDFDAVFYRNGRQQGQASSMFYKLLAMVERLREKKLEVCIIIIINDDGQNLRTLDERILSRCSPSILNFEPYSQQQLRDILADRAKRALAEKLPSYALDFIGEITGKTGDARRAINMLRVTIENMWAYRSDISAWDISQAAYKVDEDHDKNIVALLTQTQKLVAGALAILKLGTDKEWHSTASIYKRYVDTNEKLTKTAPLEYRRFSDTLNQLEERRVVESRRVFAGRSGARKEYAIRLEYVGYELLGVKYWNKMVETKRHLKELAAIERSKLQTLQEEGELLLNKREAERALGLI